jgi:hypothetical protein
LAAEVGRVCVARTSELARAVAFPTWDNGTLVGATKGPTHFCYLAGPGPHRLTMKADNDADASVVVEGGHDYVLLQEVDYVFGATGVHTRAAEAWEQRSGVCQDMAHLAIGALRAVGIPARYVSGYLMPTRASEIGVPYEGESHAWVQFWDGAWVGVDPTNNILAGDLHIEVAAGRDYGDVAPLAGIFSGGATSHMFVSVEMTRRA